MKPRLLLISLLWGSRLFAQTVMDDTLTGPSLNTSLWSVEANAPGSGSVSSDANLGMVLTLQPGIAARGIASTCRLAGDFDVQVGITLVNWPAQNLYGLRLGAVDLGTGPFGEVGIYREGGGEFYTAAFASGTVHTPTTNSDKTTTLRLKRIGSTLSAYFFSGSAWVQVGGASGTGSTTTVPTRFNLDISSSNPSAGGVTVAFRAFKVTSGTISCPPLSVAVQAATVAKTLLDAPYGYGGKGYDFLAKSYVAATAIVTGYNYQLSDCATEQPIGLRFASGIDCSGLVMWAYNTASGATTQFALSPSGTNNNPVIYPTANSQFIYNTIHVSETDLSSGDLLFFNFAHGTDPTTGKPKLADHVAMYIGGDDVIEAPDCGIPVRLASRSTLEGLAAFVEFRRVTSPIIDLKIVPSPDAPVSLAVTDPDGLSISAHTVTFSERETLREIADVLYYNDADQVFSPVLKAGAYSIQAIPKPGLPPTDSFSLTATAAGSTLILAQNVSLSDIPPLGYGIISTGTTIHELEPVGIDVKPHDFPNAINPQSRGTVPVAILSNDHFDAFRRVTVDSLTFGRTGAELSLAFCDSQGEDVNNDGRPDLVCHFYTRKTGFQNGTTVGILEGRLTGGRMIRGTDSIITVR